MKKQKGRLGVGVDLWEKRRLLNEKSKEHIIDNIVGDILRAEALGETLANKLRGVIGWSKERYGL